MHKYTASDEIVKLYKRAKNAEKDSWIKMNALAEEISGERVFVPIKRFWDSYLPIKFYSETAVRSVPVNGIQIPARYFKVTKV